MTVDYEGFQQYLALSDRHLATVSLYLRSLKFVSSNISSWEELPNFLSKLKLEGKSGTYLNTLVFSVRTYAKFKDLQDLQKFQLFKVSPASKATFSDEEIEKFLSVKIDYRFKYSEIRWGMFWKLVIFTGARCGEIAHLRVEDVDWGRGVLNVNGKTGERIVPIPANIVDDLKKYLESSEGYLFQSKRSGKDITGRPVVTDELWGDDFKRRINLIGIRRSHLTPHSFRHSFGTTIWEETKDLYSVKELLGHKNLNTTLIYTHLSTKALTESQEKHRLIRRHSDPSHILKALINTLRGFQLENDNRFKFQLDESQDSVRLEVQINHVR